MTANALIYPVAKVQTKSRPFNFSKTGAGKSGTWKFVTTENNIFTKKIVDQKRSFPVRRHITKTLEDQAVNIDLDRRDIYMGQILKYGIGLGIIGAMNDQLICRGILTYRKP